MLLKECYNHVWVLGDGNTATGVRPTQTYAQDGAYTVSLTVAFACDLTSYDGIDMREWDLNNDGVTDSTKQNPAYVYAEDGVYTVKLTVYENQPRTTYDPDTLDYDTEYYWQIVATDSKGASSEGGVWSFTTVATPNDPPHRPVKISLLKEQQMP